jgi:hypothetical protein
MRGSLVLVAAIAAGLAGCGNNGRQPARGTADEVRATLHAYADATRDHDYRAQCALISLASALSAARLAPGAHDCVSALAVINRHTKPAQRKLIDAATVTLSGDRASVRSDGGGTAQLVRQNGGWRIEILPPSPAVPDPVAAGEVPQAATSSAAAASGGPADGDAAAKSDARQAVSLIESCVADRGTYAACVPVDGMPTDALPVDVRAVSADGYEIAVRSASGTEYRITRGPSGIVQRSCTAAQESSGCPDGTW